MSVTPYKFRNQTIEELIALHTRWTQRKYDEHYADIVDLWNNRTKDIIHIFQAPDVDDLLGLAVEKFVKTELAGKDVIVEKECDIPDPDGPYGFVRNYIIIRLVN